MTFIMLPHGLLDFLFACYKLANALHSASGDIKESNNLIS